MLDNLLNNMKNNENNMNTVQIRANNLKLGDKLFINDIIIITDIVVTGRKKLHVFGVNRMTEKNFSKAFEPEQKVNIVPEDEFQRLLKQEMAQRQLQNQLAIEEEEQDRAEERKNIRALTVGDLKKILANKNDNQFVLACTEDNDYGYVTVDNIEFE